jgi:hypothetical protein
LGGACNMHRRNEKCVQNLIETSEGEISVGRISVNGTILLGLIY